MMNAERRNGVVPFLLLLALPVAAAAQTQGQGSAPPLEIENVTVIGKRVVVLPAARKGEVTDSSLYLLPPGDSLMFGERISTLAGSGGALPGYAEFEPPAHLTYEASLGSFLSPRGLVRAEYIRRSFDVAGLVDYRGTAGHVDGAEASSLLIAAHGGVSFGGDDPVLGRSRVSAEGERIGESYNLYGLVRPANASFIERGRTLTTIGARLASTQGGVVDYDLHFALSEASVRDADSGRATEATATTPRLGFLVGYRFDSVRVALETEYETTSLLYTVPTQTPALLAARATAEWRPSESVLLTGGLLYASGESSDGESTTLVMPVASLRYDLSPTATLSLALSPELRPPSYRDRIMAAPYVNREILLRPEKVPVSVAAGGHLLVDGIALDGRVFYRAAENTPVVVADSGATGSLRYDHVDSRSVGLAASLRWQTTPELAIAADAVVQSAVETGSSQQLPMTPQIDLRGRGDFLLTPLLTIFGTVEFQSARSIALVSTPALPDLPADFLLGAGGSYRILPSLEAFAEVTNLLNSSYERWWGYQAPGFEIRGGIRGTF